MRTGGGRRLGWAPNVFLDFVGQVVFARTCQAVRAGEELRVSYGPEQGAVAVVPVSAGLRATLANNPHPHRQDVASNSSA